MSRRKAKSEPGATGRLRIGDDWNAITIIALSQNNPLKAVAEFVENSIDAHARLITITRGRERGEHYLRVVDDGAGIPRDAAGVPDFKYVATHVCDSIKRRLKEEGMRGLQGEFGIGLLSFWTVGERLTLISAGADGHGYEMRMRKGDPGYVIQPRRLLFAEGGTRLEVMPLLPGIRQFSGEKLQWYLASELRDRIRQSGVRVRVIDRIARKEYDVEPRQFAGRLLHHVPRVDTPLGEAYLELYLADPGGENHVELHRAGTRVLADLSELDAFQRTPWSGGALQGLIDAPFLNLTPGTRTGVVHDEALGAFLDALGPVEDLLLKTIDEQRKAEEERASQHVLRTIQKAFKEALLALPVEEYDWFDIHRKTGGAPLASRPELGESGTEQAVSAESAAEGAGDAASAQRQFFDYAGPLYSVRVSPESCVVPVNETRTLRAIPRDQRRRLVETGLRYEWRVLEGAIVLEGETREIVTVRAPAEPGLARVGVRVWQEAIGCEAEGVVTVTDSILPEVPEREGAKEGLPGYTFRRAPGELWRSKFDADQNVIVINNGHRDFVFASRSKALKIRYICRLYCKELVQKNFPGESASTLLERLIELSLYTEEYLR